jgi:hypothetical protein
VETNKIIRPEAANPELIQVRYEMWDVTREMLNRDDSIEAHITYPISHISEE